jgi:hypothetical protein
MASAFLRRIREMVFLEKKNIAKREQLMQAALECGLDTARFASDLSSTAPRLFEQDLALARQFGVRGFPAIYFSNGQNNSLNIYGFAPYADFESALRKLSPGITPAEINTAPGKLFEVHPTYTTKEFSTVSGTSKPEAEKILEELVKSGAISRYESRHGALWKRKIAVK